jgi:acetoin utilization deacetylase AcuC-like enzyme
VGLSLTTKSYVEISSTLHQLAHDVSNGRYLVFGGGGYESRNVSRCWALIFITVAGAVSKNVELYRTLFDKEILASNLHLSREVQNTINDVKKTLFPLHGISSL